MMKTDTDEATRTLSVRGVAVHFVVIGLLLAVVLAAVWLGFGRLAAEKTLTLLALPAGCVILVLAYACFLAARFGNSVWLTVVLLFSLTLYGVVGSGFAADWLFYQLERDFYEIRPLQSEPFDVLIVLGGGTRLLDDGRVQLNASGGDRIATAARMYHSDKADNIVLLGGADPSKVTSAAEAAGTLLTQLGVAPDDIRTLVAENTWEELREVSALLNRDGEARVGLVTSAWHMRRALRLARSRGLNVAPVPADFQSLDKKNSPDDWIPTGWGFGAFTIAAKEFLAGWVGR